MPKFSAQSLRRLETCDPRLQRLFRKVVEGFDCSVICGHRTLEEQQDLYASGRTKPGPILTYQDGVKRVSKHQYSPSLAVDVVPYPVNWKDEKRFYYFGGYVRRVAEELGIDVVWGGDWNMNTEVGDQTFFDLPHWELK